MVQCPNCGYNVADDQARVCPNCGRALGTSLPGLASRSYPSGEAGGTPPQPTYPEYPGYAPPSQPAYPPSYGQPAAPSQPAYPPGYGQPGSPSQGYPYGYPPGYGQPGSPSQGYPPTYGQPGSPSQGYPPTYGQPGSPSQGYPGYPYGYPPGYGQPVPGAPGTPGMPPQKRSRVGLIVSIVLGVVVVIGLLTAGLLAIANSQGGTNGNIGGASSTATSIGSASTATSSTTPIFSDPLTSNANGWISDQHCFFRSDGYHIVGDGNSWDCLAPPDVPSNFSVQVQVKQVAGPTNDGYGIAFRHAGTGSAYFFLIDGNGHWSIQKCVSSNCSALSDWASSGGAVHPGLNKGNTLEVDATGSHFVFLANGKRVGQVDDSAFSSGSVGLDGPGTQNSEVVFTNIIINQLGS